MSCCIEKKKEKKGGQKGEEERRTNLVASNWFLTELMKTFPPGPKARVFSSDELSKQQVNRTPFVYIVNFSPAGEEGTHFVALVRRSVGKLWYIDPLNKYRHPTNDIPNFLAAHRQKYGTEIVKINRAIQSELSHQCGYFALFYCYLGSPHLRQLKLQPFSKRNLMKNDCIVLENLSAIFETYLL